MIVFTSREKQRALFTETICTFHCIRTTFQQNFIHAVPFNLFPSHAVSLHKFNFQRKTASTSFIGIQVPVSKDDVLTSYNEAFRRIPGEICVQMRSTTILKKRRRLILFHVNGTQKTREQELNLVLVHVCEPRWGHWGSDIFAAYRTYGLVGLLNFFE